MQHISMDPTTDNDYWRYSWAEMGLYDDPANIGFIREYTGQKPYYIGHSQGTS